MWRLKNKALGTAAATGRKSSRIPERQLTLLSRKGLKSHAEVAHTLRIRGLAANDRRSRHKVQKTMPGKLLKKRKQ
jgi:hypothetical protein